MRGAVKNLGYLGTWRRRRRRVSEPEVPGRNSGRVCPRSRPAPCRLAHQPRSPSSASPARSSSTCPSRRGGTRRASSGRRARSCLTPGLLGREALTFASPRGGNAPTVASSRLSSGTSLRGPGKDRAGLALVSWSEPTAVSASQEMSAVEAETDQA